MKGAEPIEFSNQYYQVQFDLVQQTCTVWAVKSNAVVLHFGIDSAVDVLGKEDHSSNVELVSFIPEGELPNAVFSVKSDIWDEKLIRFEFFPDCVVYSLKVKGNGERLLNLLYLLNRKDFTNATDFSRVYAPRFDWFKSQVIIDKDQNECLSCQQWLSPPPFSYVFINNEESVYCGVAAQPGQNNFLSFDYLGQNGPVFNLSFEGHTLVNGDFETPKLIIGFGSCEKNEAIGHYIDWLRNHGLIPSDEPRDIPEWWQEPIFCGWGQMRYDYRMDHDGHENGNFVNVTDYCTEYLYREYIRTLESHHIDPGTIIIDMGWSQHSALSKPNQKKWQDLKAFIAEQHEKKRHVLLWYSPVITDGLPLEACMTLGGRAVCPDPTSPAYQAILDEAVREMVSDEKDYLNADGFKIDFTQNTPSESGIFTGYIPTFWGLINEDNPKHLYPRLGQRSELIQTHGNKWGVEILREYIRLLYAAMKKYKNDSVLITHTANPYFSDIVDILRLNDLDGTCDDVLAVMQNRAAIVKMCSRNWLIDTDNDLMIDLKSWRDYIQLQPQLGIPDTYYASAIAHSMEPFEENDFNLLREVWAKYRASIQCND